MKRFRRPGIIIIAVISLMLNGFAMGSPMGSPDTNRTTDLPEQRISLDIPENESPDRDFEWDGIKFPYGHSLNRSFFFQDWFGNAFAASHDDDLEHDDHELTGMGGSGDDSIDIPEVSPDGSRVFPMAKGTFRITQGFGCVPFDPGYAQLSSCPPDRPSFHNGIDMGADEGAVIYAAATGYVMFADIDPNNTSGNSVIRIDHDGVNGNYRTEYLHWKSSYVETGDYVIAGQPIGEVGSIGYSSGPHLHFSVWDMTSGEAIDPFVWLQTSGTLATAGAVGGDASGNVLRWEPQIKAAASKYSVPAALIAAIITVESSGDPNAISPVGAQGLMQVMPKHFERYGIGSPYWLDPETNIDTGTRFLAELIAAHGTLSTAVAGYFGEGCDVLGTCTGEYVTLVFSWYAYYASLFDGQPVDPGIVASAGSTPNPAPIPQPTATPEPMPTAEPEPTTEPEPTATAEPASTPEVQASPTPEPTRTPDVSPSPEPEPSPTPEPTPTEPASTPTPEPSPSPSPEPSPSPSPEPTPSPTPDDSDDGEEPDEQVPDVQVVVAVAEGHGSIWRVNYKHHTLQRVNPETDEVIAEIEVGESPFGVTVSEASVWVSDSATNTVRRVDPETNSVTNVIEVGADPRGLLVTEEGVWVANHIDHTVSLISMAENVVIETVDVGQSPCYLSKSENVIFVTSCETDEIFELAR